MHTYYPGWSDFNRLYFYCFFPLFFAIICLQLLCLQPTYTFAQPDIYRYGSISSGIPRCTYKHIVNLTCIHKFILVSIFYSIEFGILSRNFSLPLIKFCVCFSWQSRFLASNLIILKSIEMMCVWVSILSSASYLLYLDICFDHRLVVFHTFTMYIFCRYSSEFRIIWFSHELSANFILSFTYFAVFGKNFDLFEIFVITFATCSSVSSREMLVNLFCK